MAILSKKHGVFSAPSSGHEFEKIKEGIYGAGRGRLNKKRELFHNDYIYLYQAGIDDDDCVKDDEVGINKEYHKIHDMDWCNNEKNEHHALNRFFENVHAAFDDEVYIIDDLIFHKGDGSEF